MSPRPPTTTEVEEGNLYYPTRLGPRYGMMAETQYPPIAPHNLPPPSSLADPRPHLPLPSHLEPSFAPQSPQLRPQYSDLPTRNHPPSARHPSYEPQSLPQDSRANRQASVPGEQRQLHASGYSHPSLYARKVSYQSGIPGTLYEALSPVGYGSHDPPGRASLFDEGTYTASPFPATGQPPHESPAGSYRSSATSSSGPATGPVPFTNPTPTLETTQTRIIPDMTHRYILQIRQQPIAARACGFGERDRRVIDPPPIVQLSLRDFDPESTADIAELRWPFNIVHCALLSVPPQSSVYSASSDVTAVPDPNQSNKLSRRLMGTLVASPFVGTDPEAPNSSDEAARLGCFFVFPDLSCRQNGLYRLRFTLMKVNIETMPEGGQGSIAGSIDSEVFEVFSAKDFPGMRASTKLTKELKKQGATVSVKKGKGERKRGSDASDRSGSEGSDGGTEIPKPRHKKRRG